MAELREQTIIPPTPVLIGTQRPKNRVLGIVSLTLSLVSSLLLLVGSFLMHSAGSPWDDVPNDHTGGDVLIGAFLPLVAISITMGLLSKNTISGKAGVVWSSVLLLILSAFLIGQVLVYYPR
jgi:hypothetical protein